MLGKNKLPSVKLLNVQGLTRERVVELEKLVDGDDNVCTSVLFLTETQHNYKRVNFSNKFVTSEKYRSVTDKKGGGFSVIRQRGSGVEVEEVECDNADVMILMIRVGGLEMMLM